MPAKTMTIIIAVFDCRISEAARYKVCFSLFMSTSTRFHQIQYKDASRKLGLSQSYRSTSLIKPTIILKMKAFTVSAVGALLGAFTQAAAILDRYNITRNSTVTIVKFSLEKGGSFQRTFIQNDAARDISTSRGYSHCHRSHFPD